MQITDLLKRESVELNGSAGSKAEALDKLIQLMVKQGNIADPEEYRKKVFARERRRQHRGGRRGGHPHAKTAAVTRPGLAFMRCTDGVEFDSLDGQPARLFFLIAAPDTRDNVHLDVLSRLSTLLMDPDFIDGIMAVDSVDGLYDLIGKAEKEKFPEESGEDQPAEEASPCTGSAPKDTRCWRSPPAPRASPTLYGGGKPGTARLPPGHFHQGGNQRPERGEERPDGGRHCRMPPGSSWRRISTCP